VKKKFLRSYNVGRGGSNGDRRFGPRSLEKIAIRIMPFLASAIRSLSITAGASPMKAFAGPPMCLKPKTFRLASGRTLSIF
jgi:hypothetical protein